MIHYGDVTKINGAEVPKVNVITFGAPCQDLSIAGKRAGMKNVIMGDEETTRSGLFFEAIRIIKEMREDDKRNGRADVDIRPRFAVYENVPGAFSSNHGEDFRAVLEETAKVADKDAVIPGPPKGKWTPAGCIMGDGWSIAWRVHDAQFWGVPQRRKRISLVADFAGGGAPEILFERKGLSGDITESGKEGKDAATDVRSSIEETSRAVSFQERAGKPGGGKGILIQNERTGALSTLNNQTVVYGISAYESNSMKSGNPNSGIYKAETARTLDLNGGSPACNQGGMMVLEGNGSRPSHKGDGYAESEISYTLNAVEQHAVCVENHPNDSRVKIREDGKCQTLSGRMGTGGNNVPMVLEQKGCMGFDNHNVNVSEDCSETLRAESHGAIPMVMEQSTYQKTTGALMASGYDKLGTQEAMNDMFVVESSAWDGSQVSPTLTANNANGGQRMPDKDNFNAVLTYGLDRASYNQGINAQYDFAVDEEKIGTQVAKGPGAVCNNYVVRRLTPMECERLQGYPVVRKVRFTEMTKDEYIAWNINEGHIVVDTEHGKVFATRGPGGIKLDEPRELPGSIVKGYRVVSIRNGETKMQCRVHRIVWIAEHGIIPDGYVIDHINNDKQDNRLCNLQLLTAAENSTKAKTDGLYKIHGESGSAKITDEVHDFIQYVYGNSDLSIRQLSEIFGISKSRVQQIIHDEPWTDIGDWVDSKGKKHKGESDSPRYKALGNSIALPFWEWMAKRMVRLLKNEEPTMASLFSGIGGFELVFARAGCKPVWASEVEDFAIAVTKRRFPDGELETGSDIGL